jgi:hypothetical protein
MTAELNFGEKLLSRPHSTLIDRSSYPDCSKCSGKRVDVRPNWKERPVMPTKLPFD